MKTQLFVLSLSLLASAPAFAQDPCDNAPNPALCRQQARSAAVVSGLVSQTPQYWNGMAAAIDDRKEREAYRAEAARAEAAAVPMREALAREERMVKALERSAGAQAAAASAAHAQAAAARSQATAAWSSNINPPTVTVKIR